MRLVDREPFRDARRPEVEMTAKLACLLLLTVTAAACASTEEIEPETRPARDAGVVVRAVPMHMPTPRGHYVRGACGIGLLGAGLIARAGEDGDTCLARFEDGRCTYQIEYGQGVGDPFGASSAIEREQVEIHEGRAHITTVRDRLYSDAFLVALFAASFPNDGPDYALSATARCELNEALDAARAVLETVDVPHVGEGLCVPIASSKCSVL
jgi:hypothetical protein